MTLKPLKIDQQNKQAIADALAKTNGNAREHTFNHFHELQALAEQAENQLDALSLKKSLRHGASMEAISGKAVPLSYSWARQATRVVIERRSSAWYLIHVSTADVRQRGGWTDLQLTQQQDAEAVSKFRAAYSLKASRPQESQASTTA